MIDFSGPVHLVGIGGAHMSAIAQILLSRGIEVSGSDLRESALTGKVRAMGGRVVIGPHDAASLGDARLVGTTVAAAEDNPELIEARRRGIPVVVRAEMVASLIAEKRVIAVAGAHGKTTTSSLIAFVLKQAGRDPMYLIGGESIDLGGNAAWGEGEICVVEADEYARAFLEYSPAVAVVTNVEPDHLDYYGTAEAYFEAFRQFAGRVKPGGRLLLGPDDGARSLAASVAAGVAVETYGFDGGDDWSAKEIELSTTGASYAASRGGERLGSVGVRVPGMHFVSNSLAAIAVCAGEGVPFASVAESVAAFRGARRRFEEVGQAGGVTVMDDYAHHPTEVRTILRAARARFGGRRIIGVFQPHTYSRTAYLWHEWTTCWDDLDALVVLETYAAREQPVAGKSAADLARSITRPPATYAADFDDAARQAADLAHEGDVVFTIGAGDVDEVGPRLLKELAR